MRYFNASLLTQLYRDAAASERKRTHYLLHESHSEKVQRLLIAMVKGSYVESHYHELPNQWEMFTLLHGTVRVCLSAKNGKQLQEVIINEHDPLPMIEFSPGEVHSVECISDQALLFEVKEGPFLSTQAKVMLEF
ncbi:MAG: WbuC family cupin fold metalloprotein [Aeromonas sp.]